MAARYWVGGSAAWDGTAGTKWALTSGGAGGQAVPTSADDVFFNAASGAVTCTISTGNLGAKSVNCTGFTGTLAGLATLVVSGSVTLSSGMALTYSGTLTFNGTGTITSAGRTLRNVSINNAGITVTLADALTINSANTFFLNRGTIDLAGFTLSTGIFASNNTDTRSISFGSGIIALTASVSGTIILSMGNATNFTWTGTGRFARTQLTTTATMSFGTTGGTVSNAPNLIASGGFATLTISNGSWFKDVTFVNSPSVVGLVNMAGNLTLSATGGTFNISPTFFASGTITSNGRSLNSVTINGAGITVTLAGAMTLGSTSTLTLTQGTFTAANFNVTTAFFSSSNTNTRTLNMGTGFWTISGAGATAWDTTTTTGLTIVPSTSTISMTSASAKTFNGGGRTYYNLRQGGAGALTISGSNTFNNITNSVQPATVTFTAGTTQTVSTFGLSGTAGNLITINSATPGSQFTLSKASGTVNAQYLSIQDSNATGGATWNALLTNGNVDAGNNTGWNFVSLAGGKMFFVFG